MVSTGPVIQDPFAVDNSCSGHPYCALNPLQFQSLTVPKIPDEQVVGFNDYCPNSSTCQWPIKYDLMPRRIYVYWQTTLTPADVGAIMAEDGYTIALSVNGNYLTSKGPFVPYPDDVPQQEWWGSAYPCDGGNATGCMATVLITNNISSVLKAATLPWNIKLEISKLEPLNPPQIIGVDQYGQPIIASQEAVPFTEATLTVTPNQTNGTTFFEAMIFPTFKSDRCMDCHGFGTIQKLQQQHGYGFDNTNSGLQPSVYIRVPTSLRATTAMTEKTATRRGACNRAGPAANSLKRNGRCRIRTWTPTGATRQRRRFARA